MLARDVAKLMSHDGTYLVARHAFKERIGQHHATQSGQHAHDRGVGDQSISRPYPDFAHAYAGIARERFEIAAQLARSESMQSQQPRHQQRDQ